MGPAEAETKGEPEGSSPRIFRWRGRRCFYPLPQIFRKCHSTLP